MLRLPKFELHQPESVDEAIATLARFGADAKILAGGTDLVPNMKLELLAPTVIVSLARVAGLNGIRRAEDGSLVIGAMTPLAAVADDDRVTRQAPCLAQAASLVAGPQQRRMGTIGGNVLLDTRCQYYNQSYFWRSALGFCLKKDGTVCHVVAGGSRCVAAASADTVPALMTLQAELALVGPSGSRTIAIDDFWTGDGIQHHGLAPAEILVSVRIPPVPPGHRGAYGKLRHRESIDFPLLGVAARLDLGAGGEVAAADLVLTALAARPRRVAYAAAALRGTRPGSSDFDSAVTAVALAACRQCHTIANIAGDEAWRRDMVAVYVTRTMKAAAGGCGPIPAPRMAAEAMPWQSETAPPTR